MSLAGLSWGFRGKPKTPLQKVLMVFLGNVSRQDGWARYDPEYWAEFCCCDEAAVIRAYKALERAGYLTTHEYGVRLGVHGVDHRSPDDCPWAPPEPRRPRTGRRSLGDSLRKLILERDGHTCTYCKDTEGPFEVDHIHPVSRGGTDDHDNLTCACRPCNQSKRAKTVEEWRGMQ